MNTDEDTMDEPASQVAIRDYAPEYEDPDESMPHGKMIHDPIHGHIHLSPMSLRFIDTEAFQRLRDLKQLGLTYYVYPGASHNRFEHSIGVAYLAYSFADSIWARQRKELPDMDKTDRQYVELAGLCHDLGHGPFSHVWDRQVLGALGITDWEHEQMSCKIFDYICDEHQIDVSEDNHRWVKSLIEGNINSATSNKGYLFDIVANKRNSVDVDKFDYLMRDSKYCGVSVSVEPKRLMRFHKVLENQVCYKWSEYHNLHELFHSREIMHRQVYTHRKAKAIEFMVVDALVEANQALKFSELRHRAEDFIQLDDTLLKQIEHYGTFHKGLVEDGTDAPLRRAQAIIRRFRRRQLYRYVNEWLIPPELIGHFKEPTPNEILSFCQGSGTTVRPEDIIISVNKIDFTMGGANPLDQVLFFDQLSDTETRGIAKQQMTSMMAGCFQEQIVRVYSRSRNADTLVAINEAFKLWQTRHWPEKHDLATPLRDKKTRSMLQAASRGDSDDHSNGVTDGAVSEPNNRKRPRITFSEHIQKRLLQDEASNSGA